MSDVVVRPSRKRATLSDPMNAVLTSPWSPTTRTVTGVEAASAGSSRTLMPPTSRGSSHVRVTVGDRSPEAAVHPVSTSPSTTNWDRPLGSDTPLLLALARIPGTRGSSRASRLGPGRGRTRPSTVHLPVEPSTMRSRPESSSPARSRISAHRARRPTSTQASRPRSAVKTTTSAGFSPSGTRSGRCGSSPAKESSATTKASPCRPSLISLTATRSNSVVAPGTGRTTGASGSVTSTSTLPLSDVTVRTAGKEPNASLRSSSRALRARTGVSASTCSHCPTAPPRSEELHVVVGSPSMAAPGRRSGRVPPGVPASDSEDEALTRPPTGQATVLKASEYGR